jgi:RNA polymerase sigma-70 factor (ECF subfamily)
MRGEAEDAFLEFRERGRPRAMARVFDHTAQELLLVAGNLARGGEEAEELVQVTYLEAMQRSASWDPARPLLPWLIGILLRQQRALRRERAATRDRERALDPEVCVRERDDDPVVHAEESELAAALASAIAALPEAYRDSLTLRLVHGLEPVQIAHALGRPLETVRTQLKRGKELLRDALPRSLAGLVLFERDGLGVVRRLVLREAQKLGAGSSLVGAGVGAMIAMKKILVMVALVGAGLWWWNRSERGTRASVEEAAVAPPVAELARAEAPDLLAQPPAPVAATREAPPTESSSLASTRASAELRCRVVWDTDGTPAADVRLELHPAGFGDVSAPLLATSNADGLASFSELEPGDVWVGADRGGETRATLAAGANELELRIPDGVDVEGVVLDERDQPVANAELWLSDQMYYEGAGLWTERTRADGRFQLRDVQAGRALAARAPGRAAAPGIIVDGEPGKVRQVTLHVGERGPKVRGIVRASGGAPIAGAILFLGSAQDTRHTVVDGVKTLFSPPAQSVSTGPDGRFEAEAVPTKLPLPVWACAEGFAVWQENVTVTEPETWIEIELARAASVSGIVRDEQGTPAAELEVFALQAGIDPAVGFAYGGPAWGRAQTWSAADGSYRLARVRPGPTALFARDRREREAHAEVELVAGEEFRWDALLRRGGEIAGVVLDERRAPIAGLEVRADAEVEGWARSNLRTLTDSEGNFRLTGAVRERYLLRIAEEHGLLDAPLYLDGIAPGTEGLEIVFPDRNRPSARFQGHLLDPSGAPFELKMLEARRIEPDSRLCSGSFVPRATDGHFSTELLPPGRYELSTVSSTVGHWIIGTFDLAAGEVRDVGTHVCPAPGNIACEVYDAEGAPLAEGEVSIASEQSASGQSAKIFDGRGTCATLQPGFYWVGFAGYEQPLVQTRVEVRAGEAAHATIRVPAGLTRWIQVPDGPAKSLLLCTYEWRRDGELVGRQCSMIGLGHQKPFDMNLVPGHYEAVLTLEDGRSATTSFDVSDATTTPEQAVVLRSPLDG